jgi:hypothetical protein
VLGIRLHMTFNTNNIAVAAMSGIDINSAYWFLFLVNCAAFAPLTKRRGT